MDKLMKELKVQQQEEVEKHGLIKVGQNEKKDLEETNWESIAEKEKQTPETSSSLSSTKESQFSNEAQLENPNSLFSGLHADCDYVIK